MKETDNIPVGVAWVPMNGQPNTEIKTDRLQDYDNNPFISFGSDNLFPQAVALMARSSPNHRGVINSMVTYFMGHGIHSKDQATTDMMQSVNFEGMNLNTVQERLFLDDRITGNAWVEIITDKNRSFLWFNHLDTTKCRLDRSKEMVIIHPDWSCFDGKSDKRNIEIPLYPNLKFERNEYGVYVARSVYHIKDYEPEFTNYGIPQWIGGKDSVEIDLKTNKWNLARLKNSFQSSGMLFVPVKDADESKKVIEQINKRHIGEGKQGKFMVVTKSRAQEGQKADTTEFVSLQDNNDGSWSDLHKQSLSDVIVSHGWYRALTGIADNTGFDTERILNEYYIALNTSIKKAQEKWIEFYKKIFREQQNKEIDLHFLNRPPVDDDQYKRIWEIRQERGLEFDEKDPDQMKIILRGARTVKSENEKSDE